MKNWCYLGFWKARKENIYEGRKRLNEKGEANKIIIGSYLRFKHVSRGSIPWRIMKKYKKRPKHLTKA